MDTPEFDGILENCGLLLLLSVLLTQFSVKTCQFLCVKTVSVSVVPCPCTKHMPVNKIKRKTKSELELCRSLYNSGGLVQSVPRTYHTE